MRKTSENLRAGFTLVEMFVVIGIILVLMGASVGGYSAMTKRAQKARGQELVSNVATALNILFQKQGRWPTALLNEADGDGQLTAKAAACLAVNKLISLSYTKVEKDGESFYTLSGLDRYGIISPWAQAAVKNAGTSGGGTGLRVPSGGTVKDHILHYALDKTGEGIVEASVGGVSVRIRANAVVWCSGMDGKEEPYPYAGKGSKGRGGDDIYSWSPSQVEK